MKGDLHMKCPFCGEEMKNGVLEGDGRTRLRWISDENPMKWVDRVTTNTGLVPDAHYKAMKFTLRGYFCYDCGKFIASIHPM
jgi:rRNA maturation protein Nop10